ncbi:MAG TPA: D-galactonate dehydratase family protein, partial [Vicinamibacterales bacterium]|nr:D-galactonate dehydratase family protein [Vicinamibacterales bacterium]
DAVTVYAHASGETIEDAVESAQRHAGMGYTAVRVQCGIPGVERPYGIARGDRYEPAERGPLSETVWNTEPYLAIVPRLFERLRGELGSEIALLHDAHHRLRPIEAARLGRALEPYSLFWLEDPTPAENPEVFRLIRQHTTTPLAVGEVFNSIHDCRQLIEEQLVDYIRTSVAHAGGITHLRRIAAVAEIHGVRTGSHGATDLSPVCLAAALHFDLHVHNFGIQEYMPHSAETDRVFPHAYRFHAGVMHPGDAPGLGVELDEALAATFPYEPAWLPVARRADGTMHDW